MCFSRRELRLDSTHEKSVEISFGSRAGNMRSYASDTALPGGKYEEDDEDDEGTAVSEPYFQPQSC